MRRIRNPSADYWSVSQCEKELVTNVVYDDEFLKDFFWPLIIFDLSFIIARSQWEVSWMFVIVFSLITISINVWWDWYWYKAGVWPTAAGACLIQGRKQQVIPWEQIETFQWVRYKHFLAAVVVITQDGQQHLLIPTVSTFLKRNKKIIPQKAESLNAARKCYLKSI